MYLREDGWKERQMSKELMSPRNWFERVIMRFIANMKCYCEPQAVVHHGYRIMTADIHVLPSLRHMVLGIAFILGLKMFIAMTSRCSRNIV